VIALVEVVGDRFVPAMPDVSQVFLESCVQWPPGLADVQFAAQRAVYHVHQVLCAAIEVFLDGELRFGALNFGGCADEWTGLAFGHCAGAGSRGFAAGPC